MDIPDIKVNGPVPKGATFKRLKDIFYETRVLMGRGYTLHRFTAEVLNKAIDPVMLSYIEKGKRFPSEGLVHRLAEVRGQNPQELLALLWQDRILYAFSKEIRRIIKADKKGGKGGDEEHGLSDADLAFLVSRAIAALPDDGGWITMIRWQRAIQAALLETGKKRSARLIKVVIGILHEQGIIEQAGAKVRRLEGEGHYIPSNTAEKRSLAMEFCGIFAKGLIDKIAGPAKETHLRNHYLQIPAEKIEAFYEKLDQSVKKVVEEYATEGMAGKKFMNVLITSTPL